MLEIIVELVLAVFGDALVELVAELFLELGIEYLKARGRARRLSNPYLAGCLFVMLGIVVGWLSTLVWSRRIISTVLFRGASLVFSPVIAGTVMNLFGRWQRNRGRVTSFLATFWGGALLAFSVALTRLIILKP